MPNDDPEAGEGAEVRRGFLVLMALGGHLAMVTGVVLLGQYGQDIIRIGWGTIVVGGITFLGATNMLRRAS